jgi:hypothetical protein
MKALCGVLLLAAGAVNSQTIDFTAVTSSGATSAGRTEGHGMSCGEPRSADMTLQRIQGMIDLYADLLKIAEGKQRERIIRDLDALFRLKRQASLLPPQSPSSADTGERPADAAESA